VKRGDLVHTPAGWAVVDAIEHVCHDDPLGRPAIVSYAVVTVERPDGTDDPRPRVYRLDELELAAPELADA
jgi:hypothetical protein